MWRSSVPTTILMAALVLVPVLGGSCIGVSQKKTMIGPDGREVPVPAALLRCPRGVRPAADGDIDDLEDANTQISKLGGRDGYWWTKKDPNGSTVEMQPDDGGASGSELALHASGVTVSAGDAWGAGFGANFVSQGLLYDASRYVGISLKMKTGPKSTRKVRFSIGDVNTHKDAGVCSSCWNHFGRDLMLAGDWKEYRILFTDMQQQPDWGSPRPAAISAGKLVSLDWAIGPGQTYDLWVDELVFLECNP